MIKIPYTKAHGAKNDFLLTWAHEAPAEKHLVAASIAITDRNTGVGADGWLLVSPPTKNSPARIRLFNSDGSEVEMSGNGTRCAAAFLVDAGRVEQEMTIVTGAGPKQLTLALHDGLKFEFAMNMGAPSSKPEQLHASIPTSTGHHDATLIWVGNPQCALFVDHFDFDWKSLGAEIERLPMFPNRTNVSFVRVLDRHTIDVRFFERGAGFTMSSGTGSTGAMAASILRGLCESPVRVDTLAGPMHFTWEGEEIHMRGPAEIVAGGEFYFTPEAAS